jgi:hypothetical protein
VNKLVLLRATFASFGPHVETIIVDFELTQTGSPLITGQAKVVRTSDDDGFLLYGIVREPWINDWRIVEAIRRFAMMADCARSLEVTTLDWRTEVRLAPRGSAFPAMVAGRATSTDAART